MTTFLQADALAEPMTRANRPVSSFHYSRDRKWRAAVTVNK